MEEKKTEVIKESGELSRADFLKMMGAAGLGIAGLGSLMSSPASAAEGKEDKKKKYVFVITSGGNNPNRVLVALIMADVVQKKELGDVNIWLTLEGAELCRKGHPEKIVSPAFAKYGNAFDIMERIHKNGGAFGVCPPCADWVSATGSNRIEWIKDQGADWIVTNIQDSQVVWL